MGHRAISKLRPKELIAHLARDPKIDDAMLRKMAILSGASFFDIFEMQPNKKVALPRNKSTLLKYLETKSKQGSLVVSPVLTKLDKDTAKETIDWYLIEAKGHTRKRGCQRGGAYSDFTGITAFTTTVGHFVQPITNLSNAVSAQGSIIQTANKLNTTVEQSVTKLSYIVFAICLSQLIAISMSAYYRHSLQKTNHEQIKERQQLAHRLAEQRSLLNPRNYKNVKKQLKRYRNHLLVAPPVVFITLLYHSYAFNSHSRRTSSKNIDLMYNDDDTVVPYKAYDNCLRTIDYRLHQLFKTSAKANDTIDALRYRLLKREQERTTFRSLLGFDTRHLLMDHLVQSNGHVRDSPYAIAHAILKYKSGFMRRMLAEPWMTRIFGNVLRSRKRSSSKILRKTSGQRTVKQPLKQRH